MFETMQPLGDKVLLKRLENVDKTPGGIFIPDAAKEKAQTGKVIAAGPGRITPEGKLIPLAVKAGDVVFVGKYSGTEAGQDYIIVREDEILGIVQKA